MRSTGSTSSLESQSSFGNGILAVVVVSRKWQNPTQIQLTGVTQTLLVFSLQVLIRKWNKHGFIFKPDALYTYTHIYIHAYICVCVFYFKPDTFGLSWVILCVFMVKPGPTESRNILVLISVEPGHCFLPIYDIPEQIYCFLDVSEQMNSVIGEVKWDILNWTVLPGGTNNNLDTCYTLNIRFLGRKRATD